MRKYVIAIDLMQIKKITETRYRTVHHDAVTHTETQTTYTEETQIVHVSGSYLCRGCGAEFETEAEINAHCDSNSVECYCAGWSGHPGHDETVTVQVPHTETVKCISIISGFVIYKRFVSKHTLMNKITGVVLFTIPLFIDILPWQPVAILIVLTCTTATFAAIQEGHYIRTGKEV